MHLGGKRKGRLFDRPLNTVIAGLDPAIHHPSEEDGSPGLGASRRPGDDEQIVPPDRR
jgi:hypothetical protein